MSLRVVDLFRRSGDAHIGQTLVRLAGLAELLHRQQEAERLRRAGGPDGSSPAGPEAGSQAVVQGDRRFASVGTVRCHREVDR